MALPEAGQGKHYENVAPLGEKPAWVVKPGAIPTVDPNEGLTLFGYSEREFMAKQYRKGKN